MPKEHKVGDEGWYIPGYHGDHLIAIRCKVTEVDDQWRKQHPEGILFYEIDEPIGHTIYGEELTSRELAEDMLRQRAYSSETLEGDLDRFRRHSMKFIVSTWRDVPEDKNIDRLLEKYPIKKRGIDWFNVMDIGMNHG